MQQKLVIGGVDFAPYIKKNGLRQYHVQRQRRSVVALNGVEYRSGFNVRGLAVSLVEIRDGIWENLRAALTSPCSVLYTDEDIGDVTKVFYLSALSVTDTKVSGGNTYLSATFTLEEK